MAGRTFLLLLLVSWISIAPLSFACKTCLFGNVSVESGKKRILNLQPPDDENKPVNPTTDIPYVKHFSIPNACTVRLIGLSVYLVGQCSCTISLGGEGSRYLEHYQFPNDHSAQYQKKFIYFRPTVHSIWAEYQNCSSQSQLEFTATISKTSIASGCTILPVYDIYGLYLRVDVFNECPAGTSPMEAATKTPRECSRVNPTSDSGNKRRTDGTVQATTSAVHVTRSSISTSGTDASISSSTEYSTSSRDNPLPTRDREGTSSLLPALIAAVVVLIVFILAICVFCMVRSGKILRTSTNSCVSFIQASQVKTRVSAEARMPREAAATASYTIDPVIYSSAGPCYIDKAGRQGQDADEAPSQLTNQDPLQSDSEPYASVASAFDNRQQKSDSLRRPPTPEYDKSKNDAADLYAAPNMEQKNHKSNPDKDSSRPLGQSEMASTSSLQENDNNDVYALPQKKAKSQAIEPNSDDMAAVENTDASDAFQETRKAAPHSLPVPKPAPYRASKAAKENAGLHNPSDYMSPIDAVPLVRGTGAAACDDGNLYSSPHDGHGEVKYQLIELRGADDGGKILPGKSASGPSCTYAEVNHSK